MRRRRTRFSTHLIRFAVIVILIFLIWRYPSAFSRLYHYAVRESNRTSNAPTLHEHKPEKERALSCQEAGTTCSSQYFQSWREPQARNCSTSIKNGYPLPDPHCTPGGVNPSITIDTLQDHDWRTGCVRNCETSEAQKHVTYEWYGIQKPQHNSGGNQVCELDHLVPLELGGADGLGNIWPECGPDSTALRNRYFKVKDRVENYLADEVKSGRMPLQKAQQGIASDWTQYLPEANRYCENGGRC